MARCAAAAVVSLIGAALAGPIVTNQPASNTEEILPLIQFEDVPLADAIRVLARQMKLNHILDPRIVARADGRRSESLITFRLQNITAREALQRVLKDHKLTIVTNAATSVARIVPQKVVVRPVPASQVGTDTNSPIPVLEMDDVPLAEAIKHIARKANLAVYFAPATSRILERPDIYRSPVTVSFRWENITARQALAALLDNYDLAMAEDTANSTARIGLKTKAGADKAR